MKNQPLTRKLKEALTAHFDRGGVVAQVPSELARISIEDRQKCYEFWKRQQELHRPRND